MLNPRQKTPVPAWAASGWQPTWREGQWIVMFVDEDSARMALDMMQADTRARLAVAPLPDGSNHWYVGVADA
jgi:hypothetical protein